MVTAETSRIVGCHLLSRLILPDGMTKILLHFFLCLILYTEDVEVSEKIYLFLTVLAGTTRNSTSKFYDEI